jgi:hypothetical protein
MAVSTEVDRSTEGDGVAAAPLRPHQVASVVASLAALHRYGGALLCDPVGSGKTRTSLEIAKRWLDSTTSSTVIVIAPAALVGWWEQESLRAGVHAVVVSMGRLSGRDGARSGAASRAGLVIVDEAHHVRHGTILRSQRLAHWVGSRACLMVTATPVVNRLDDLVQLAGYFLRRTDAIDADTWRNIIVSNGEASQRGRSTGTFVIPPPPATMLSLVDRAAEIAAADVPDVAPLVRAQLWARWTSSEYALEQSLRRMSRYWRELGIALAHGRKIQRADIVRHIELPQQAVLPFALDPTDLPISAFEATHIASVLQATSAQIGAIRWGRERRQIVANWVRDAPPAVLFTESADTARVVTETLAADGLRTLCLTAAGAWGPAFGSMRLVDGLKLATGELAAVARPPNTIVCTPVVSEGQNLQFAAQVIHLDPPWNPGRVEQRVGRVDRMGATGAVLERALVAPDIVRQRVDPWGAIARKRADVEGWRADPLRIAQVAAESALWPATRAELDAVWRVARALVRAGQGGIGARLIEEVAAAWAAGPGVARRASWPGVSPTAYDAAFAWAAAGPRDRYSVPEPSLAGGGAGRSKFGGGGGA